MCIYSGTSDNGHSEEWTTSLQWIHCSPPAYILSIPPKKGQLLNNEQNARPQCVHYSEVPYIQQYKGIPVVEVLLFPVTLMERNWRSCRRVRLQVVQAVISSGTAGGTEPGLNCSFRQCTGGGPHYMIDTQECITK